MKKSQNNEFEFEDNVHDFLDTSAENVTDMYFKEVAKTENTEDQDLSDNSGH